MSWKTVGQSVIGVSHLATGKGCEDAIAYKTIRLENGEEVLLCVVSDGAGSASHAAEASSFVTEESVRILEEWSLAGVPIGETSIMELVEILYEGLEQRASGQQEPINEYSCTFLGCVVSEQEAVFFQLGDGAMVRNVGMEGYTYIVWPQNGEYQNSTFFLIDNKNCENLMVKVLAETIDEVSIFTDGLQMLALNMDAQNVHQPFFEGFFKYLRMADDEEKRAILNEKLRDYLGSNLINERTDDDKTLFLATRIKYDRTNV